MVNALESSTRTEIINCNIESPLIYTLLKDFDAQNYLDYLDCVKLIIRVPKTNNSSIAVLEGDYSFDTNIENLINLFSYSQNITDNIQF